MTIIRWLLRYAPAGSTVKITQMMSPKKSPECVAILHCDSYMPGSDGDRIRRLMSVFCQGPRHPTGRWSTSASSLCP